MNQPLTEWVTDLKVAFMRQGHCQGMDTNLFFPYKGTSSVEALKACNGTEYDPVCPVKTECLEYAMSLPVVCVGIWGGTTPKDRRRIRSDTAEPVRLRA